MSRGGASYHERQLTPEERALIAQQQRYLASIQPSIDKLVNRGTSLLDDVVNPDWGSIYTQTVNDIDNLRKEQAQLATGQLPQAYSDAKMNYFNRIYENTMGKNLANMAKSGIVDSSRLNSTTNDMQKNMAAQMSQDYTNDIKTQSALLDQKYEFAKSPLEMAHKANEYSFANPSQHLALAQGQSKSTNDALQVQSQMNNGRTTMVQKGPGFLGGLLNAGMGFLACFPAGEFIELEHGFKPIEEVEVGDIVVSDNPGVVKDVLEMGEQDIVSVYAGHDMVMTTWTQTFKTRDGFVPLKDLKVGDEVLTSWGYKEIVAIKDTGKKETVYELYLGDGVEFYAGGFCVEGLTEEEYNAVHSMESKC